MRGSVHGTENCHKHLRIGANSNGQEEVFKKIGALEELLRTAAQRQWKPPNGYERVLERSAEIEQGKRPGSDLVILDCEWSVSSGQLWELAVIEKVSGKHLVNTRVRHESSWDHANWKGSEALEALSRRQAINLLKSTSSHGLDYLSGAEIADMLEKAGITNESMFLVWHRSTTDLDKLRELLESTGHQGLLPPNEKRIGIQTLFLKNVARIFRGRPVSWALEVLFPSFFPRHHLVGLNHRALVDCQQARLLALAFEHLCKPIGARSKY